MLANLIALQIGRSPQLRTGIVTGVRGAVDKGRLMKAGMDRLRSEDPARYERIADSQAKLSSLNDGPGIPLEELERVESTIALDALAASAGLVEPVARMVWVLLDGGDAQFFTGDHLVVDWPVPDAPAFYGTGLFTASRTTFPLSPRYCLELTVPETPAAADDGPVRAVDVGEVDEINAMTAGHAATHIVMHPSIGWTGHQRQQGTSPR